MTTGESQTLGKIPKLRRCPHCRSTLVKIIDTKLRGANIGGYSVYVKCECCKYYAPAISYDWPYMFFLGHRNVKFDLQTAVRIVAMRWNARTLSEHRKAEDKANEYAKTFSAELI